MKTLLAFGAVYVIAAAVVNDHVPENYMDEPFHVPQTRRYCEGDYWSWDAKITTFPGLYIFGTGYAWLLSSITSIPITETCSTAVLRTLNIIFSLACIPLFKAIHMHLHWRQQQEQQVLQQQACAPAGITSAPAQRPSAPTPPGSITSCKPQFSLPPASPSRPQQQPSLLPGTTLKVQAPPKQSIQAASWTSIMLALYPLHFFYTFLYYTDVGSLASILACYLLLLKRRHLPSALLGAVSVIFRQTNAVWVCFIAAAGVLRDVREFRALLQQLLRLGREQGIRSAELAVHVGKGRQAVLRAVAQLVGQQALSAQPSAASAASEDVASEGASGGAVASRQQGQQGQQQPGRAAWLDSPAGSSGRNSSRRQYLEALASPAPDGLAAELRQVLQLAWRIKWQLLSSYSALMLVPLAFAAFVVYNEGSVTVGDKAAHAPVKHLAQMLYLGLFIALAAPLHFVASGSLPTCACWCWQQLRRRPLRALCSLLLAAAAAAGIVWRFTLEHPYLLSDNRHLIFYLWQRVMQRHWAVRYALVPAYLYSWWAVSEPLARQRGSAWVLALLGCCALTLVPAWLLELRYFTVPFVLVLLHTPAPALWRLRLTSAAYLLVDLLVLHMFTMRTFTWPDGSVARFMW